MTRRTNEEIVNALKVIRDVCEYVTSNGDESCDNCPLTIDSSLGNGSCGIVGVFPSEWKINEVIDWKAF